MWQFGALLSQLSPELAEVCRVIKLDIGDKDHPINILITKFQNILLENLRPKLQLLDKLLNREQAKLINLDSDRISRFTNFHN